MDTKKKKKNKLYPIFDPILESSKTSKISCKSQGKPKEAQQSFKSQGKPKEKRKSFKSQGKPKEKRKSFKSQGKPKEKQKSFKSQGKPKPLTKAENDKWIQLIFGIKGPPPKQQSWDCIYDDDNDL